MHLPINKRHIELILIIIVIGTLIGLTYYLSANDIFGIETPLDTKGYIHQVSVLIDSPYWNASYYVENTTNITAAALLFECTSYYNLSVAKEYWSGYKSYYITSIGNLSNGLQERYWQYYVNGNYADKGCSKYILSDNDQVIWTFEQSAWSQ
jgi:hypothetical protein